MDLDLTPFFSKYKEIVDMVDTAFERVKKEYPENVNCKEKCSDCCYALFDLTLIEAIYLNNFFNNTFKGKKREKILEKLNRADRRIHVLKKQAYRDIQAGKEEADILMKMANERVRCPLLNEKDKCDLYEHRPITCRLYGIPVSSGGMVHTCGKSGFIEGHPYNTVKLEIIQGRLFTLSAELVSSFDTKYTAMAEMLVPLSMALLTEYDEEYMGIKKSD